MRIARTFHRTKGVERWMEKMIKFNALFNKFNFYAFSAASPNQVFYNTKVEEVIKFNA